MKKIAIVIDIQIQRRVNGQRRSNCDDPWRRIAQIKGHMSGGEALLLRNFDLKNHRRKGIERRKRNRKVKSTIASEVKMDKDLRTSSRIVPISGKADAILQDTSLCTGPGAIPSIEPERVANG